MRPRAAVAHRSRGEAQRRCRPTQRTARMILLRGARQPTAPGSPPVGNACTWTLRLSAAQTAEWWRWLRPGGSRRQAVLSDRNPCLVHPAL